MQLHRDQAAALDTLVRDLLQEERGGTAVEAFSRWHERAPEPMAPAQARYRNLLPLSHPKPGEQYAFEVDLTSCSGCKACVTACHSLNGLEEGESWRSVGLLVSRSNSAQVAPLQHVTTACHHCVEPACQHGCPVLAYDKDPVTGIVRHLDDQCIGCTYCIMTCPYEVPRFSKRLGIVRKCDLCQGRLAEGEAPACAQACPNQAIRITVVDQASLRHALRSGPSVPEIPSFPPSAPSSAITVPTTRFRAPTGHLTGLSAADENQASPAPLHLPLVLMLVLTQAAAGMALVLPFLDDAPRRIATPAILAVTVAGLAASVAHLGRPLRAWRIFLGWRRSWLSREAMLLGAFAATALLATAGDLLLAGSAAQGSRLPHALLAILAPPAVLSSVMVYAVTARPEWSLARTGGRFLGTSLFLGAAFLAVLPLPPAPFSPVLLAAMAAAGCAVTAFGELVELHSWSDRRGADASVRRRQRLAQSVLRPWWILRIASAGLGLLFLAWASAKASGGVASPLAVVALPLLLIAALVERALFFAGSSPHRMPGGVVA